MAKYFLKLEKDKKKTDWDRIAEWEQQIEDIDALIADNKEKAVAFEDYLKTGSGHAFSKRHF